MKTGSHNTMSYLAPRRWYMYLWRWVARCQSRDVKSQWEHGARLYDIRVRYDSRGHMEIAHGMMTYSGGSLLLHNIMRWLDKRGRKESVSVRIIYESRPGDTGDKNLLRKEVLFMHLCEKLEKTYTHLHFFGGERKSDWNKIYHFASRDIDLEDMYGSQSGHLVYSMWPWLYTKTHRKELERAARQESDKILFRDFI